MNLFHNGIAKFKLRGKTSIFLVIMYFLLWLFFMTKKMDLLFFPYNDMFSHETKNDSVFYVLKRNGQIVPITKKFYWKKDLLEQSILSYVKYHENDDKRYVDQFFLSRKDNNKCYGKIYPHLKTPDIGFKDWAKWYLHQSGVVNQPHDKVEILEMHWKKIGENIVFTDSSTVNSVEL